MNEHDLFVAVFDKELSNSETESLLTGLSEKYPYFPLPAYYLLKETDTNHPDYTKRASKTALFFNNPYLLAKQLAQLPELIETCQVPPIEEPIVEQPKADEQDNEEANPTKILHKPTLKIAEPPLFEPLFATDYFASQGIKLSEEVQNADKLGKQLKSFTEWLKSMKKVHNYNLPGTNPQQEIAVQQLAEKSNQEADVLTESMAEAFLQQGKNKKAIEIWEKLSLLNPTKSAYFAAKITQSGLKKTS